jgi:pilus assembly protein Flp/PilA
MFTFESVLIEWVKNNWKRQEGQAMAEYGIILALIAAVVIATLALLGTKIETAFTTITGKL